MLWVDPTDASVFFAVSGMEPDETDEDNTVLAALAQASDILTAATGGRVHPAGTATEEFIAPAQVQQLRPSRAPLVSVQSVQERNPVTGDLAPTSRFWAVVQGSVHFGLTKGTVVQPWRQGSGCARPDRDVLVVEYTFGSTVGAGARASVLAYARQLWLAANDEDECALPDRVTSLTREGLSMEMFDPADYLDRGKVGLPRVDTWLASINPTGKARRPAAVWTPDRPPGVATRVVTRPR